MNLKRIFRNSFLVLLLILMVIGCDVINEHLGENTGSITIDLQSETRTIDTDISMVPAYYTISGVGPNELTFTESIDGETLTIDELYVGFWEISVLCFNNEDILIGEGSASTTITAGTDTELDITVTPLTGDGTVNLTLGWDSSDFISTPEITATMTRVSDNTVHVIEFVITDTSATYEGNFTSGYYNLSINVTDGNSTVSYVDSVRIVKNQSSTAIIQVGTLSEDSGNLIMQIVTELQDPIEITFSGNQSTIYEGSEMTISVSTDVNTIDSYIWYLDGIVIVGESSSSITIGSGIDTGTHSLAVQVTSGNISSTESILFTVNPPGEQLDHLLMVYIDGDNDLEGAAIDDINEMESINLQNSGVKVIVLVDRIDGYDSSNGNWTGTRLYEITYDSNGYDNTITSLRLSGMGLSSSGNEELNMGDGEVLSSFVNYGKTNFFAENYSLFLWNHGGGWRNLGEKKDVGLTKAVCWDETDGSDALYMEEVGDVLTGQNLAVIGFDACLMGMIEVGYELKDTAEIMVASEELEPFDGWDYQALLSSFITTDLSAIALGDSIVNSYGDFYEIGTMSAVDLSMIDSVIEAQNTFISSLMTQEYSLLQSARNSSESFVGSYVDLSNFASNLSDLSGSSALLTALDSYVISNFAGYDMPNASGVSIYFPSSLFDYEYVDYNGENISYPNISEWDEFLAYYLTDTEEPEDEYESDNSAAEADINNRYISLDEVQYHNFHIPSDEDWVKFTATADVTYLIETSFATTATDTVLYLYDTDGETPLAANDDRNLYAGITYTFPTTGTYYIRCTPYSSAYPGEDYNITVVESDDISIPTVSPDIYESDDSVLEADNNDRFLYLNNTQHHNFHTSTDEDWMKFTATGGVEYLIETSIANYSADTMLYLYDTDGVTELAFNDDRTLYAGITYTIPVSGTYYIKCRSYSSAYPGDDYNITLLENGVTE